MAQQVFGGHGYIAEHGMEQFVRDARIAMIYEGANGIQALDLVGRKLGQDGGRAMMAFFNEVGAFIKEKGADEAMKPFVDAARRRARPSAAGPMWFMQNAMAKPDNAGAGSDRLHASLRPGRARLHVVPDRRSRARQVAKANGAAPRMKRQARHRALLHGAHAAGNGRAPRAASRRAPAR